MTGYGLRACRVSIYEIAQEEPTQMAISLSFSKTVAALFGAALLAGPAAANVTLDFTSSAINAPNVTNLSSGIGSITYSITSSPGSLTNASHKNNVDCTGQGWDFACSPVSNNRFDVGFGVQGNNPNEVDGNLNQNEYVQVSFSSDVFLNGFAGMLTYFDGGREDGGGNEDVLLEAYLGGTLLTTFSASPLKSDNGNTFDTVGLAFLDSLNLRVDEVRFLAGGTPNFDDGTANITAAGLKISAVPLPAGVLLLGLGLGGLAAYRRRQAA